MSKFWSPFVKDLVPYVPGEQPKLAKLVKLNTNENPYGPSPRAIAAMQAEINDGLRLYPDPNGERLKQAVADYYGVQMAQLFVGNGSDEVLAHAFHGLFQHGRPLLFPDVTYSFYPVYCGLYGIDYQTVALNEQFQIDVADYQRPNGGIIFPNPNAPTGCLLPLEAIERLLQANSESVVLVDEAYVDFGGESAIALVDCYPNLLVTQTLSKSRSLAGLRVGLAFAQGLGAALDRPVVGLSTLDALAESLPQDPAPTVALIDARRGQVYARSFDQGAPHGPAAALTLAEAAQEIVALDRRARLVGTGVGVLLEAFPDLAPILADARAAPSPEALARLTRATDPASSPPRPLYLRAPEATPPSRLPGQPRQIVP